MNRNAEPKTNKLSAIMDTINYATITKFPIIAYSVVSLCTLDVHVYDWAKVPTSTLDYATQTLARILRASGIQLRWIMEQPDSREGRTVMLVNPPRPGHERDAACAARRDIALLILPDDTTARFKRGVLGYAEPLAPAGVNTTVFYARSIDAAHEHGIPVGLVLGHAIAHEIGHVLLRTSSHRKGGLMAGGWDSTAFQFMRRSDLPLDKDDARLMRATITGEGCSRSVRSK